ncbi:MAG: RecQ family ATP-dependent DNA helicase [Prevotella sp.]|nr:RecQ family ATP-dependent DNA helicase [Prevotella sp.]
MDKYQQILKDYWGYDHFRGIQREIIDSITAGKDTLGLMPTGGGKSITFQVPAIAQQGVCLVITPLIALMKDQVDHLRDNGVLAAAIYNSMSRKEILTTLDNATLGGVKILYVSPERLSSELFLKKLQYIPISFVTVDEAHCISQWGYDFRPSYLKIAMIRKIKPEVPFLALTATATPEVIKDIQQQLQFREENVFRMSFVRKNLSYVVRRATDKEEELLHILRSVDGCSIVYVRNRKKTKEIADYLSAHGIKALAYHAGLDSTVRDERQQLWHDDQVRVMVATNAFGMGIDKPDVRTVIHLSCPDSLEAYFQEAGRGGRDGKRAYAVLLYNESDRTKLKRRVTDNFPDKETVKKVYEHLAYYYQIGMGMGANTSHEFNMDEFCQNFKHFPTHVESALMILERAGYISYDEERDNKARLCFTLSRSELSRLESLSENETNVITTLLRNYGGLFSEYNYIDESFVAKQAQLTPQQVYMILKNLNGKHILHFIPHKKTPYITYLQRREDIDRMMIPQEVYEDRKRAFIQRLQWMINYATNDRECRSQQLLRYFGETDSEPCGHCDVCISRQKDERSEARQQSAIKEIIALLSDGREHPLYELHQLTIAKEVLDSALEYLVNEEIVSVSDSFITLTKDRPSPGRQAQ